MQCGIEERCRWREDESGAASMNDSKSWIESKVKEDQKPWRWISLSRHADINNDMPLPFPLDPRHFFSYSNLISLVHCSLLFACTLLFNHIPMISHFYNHFSNGTIKNTSDNAVPHLIKSIIAPSHCARDKSSAISIEISHSLCLKKCINVAFFIKLQ